MLKWEDNPYNEIIRARKVVKQKYIEWCYCG